MNVNEIMDTTRKVLGPDADLSYITEENLELLEKTEPTEITTAHWDYNGNTLTRFPDGHWEWFEGCITKVKYTWNGNLNSTRLPNCATGLIHFRIWG